MPSFRWGLGALAAAAAAACVSCSLPGQAPPTGTLLVLVSGAAPGRAALGAVEIHSESGWHRLGSYAGDVPAAPAVATAVSATLPAGPYDALKVGGAGIPLALQVPAGQVEPLLVGLEAGRPLPHGLYAGTANVNLGIRELAGRLPALPAVQLEDQAGRSFDTGSLAGRVTLIAAFRTGSHEAGALMTALLAELKPKLGGVRIVEVSADPAADRPSQLSSYAAELGVGWTLATGSPASVSTLLYGLGLESFPGDVQASGLAVVDSHGYEVKRFTGIPDPGPSPPAPVSAYLSGEGAAEVRAHGSGWGVGDILAEIRNMVPAGGAASSPQGPAPDFQVAGWDGRTYSLSSFGGRPLVINFWASWCVPCRTEMPLLQREARRHPGVAFLFVDERDDQGTARGFLAGLGVKDLRSIASDPDGSLGERFRVADLPTTVFLRADGTIDAVHPGQLDEPTISGFLADLGG